MQNVDPTAAAPVVSTDVEVMALRLADRFCRTIVRCEGVRVTFMTDRNTFDEEWYDTKLKEVSDDMAESIDYLEARGLLVRHRIFPACIKLVEPEHTDG